MHINMLNATLTGFFHPISQFLIVSLKPIGPFPQCFSFNSLSPSFAQSIAYEEELARPASTLQIQNLVFICYNICTEKASMVSTLTFPLKHDTELSHGCVWPSADTVELKYF